MTTAENLNRIIQAKADIKQAIENKGVTLSAEAKIDEFSYAIRLIPQEISEGKWVVPNGTLFQGSNFSSFDGRMLDVSNITNMNGLFKNCHSVTSIDVTGWNTASVTDMSNLFNTSSLLTEIKGLQGLDLSSVTTISSMFYYCSKITSIDVAGWNTGSISNMGSLFEYCSVLTEINGIENFDTKNLTDMSRLFANCSKLTSVDLSKWDLSKVTSMASSFAYCKALTEVKMGGDVSKLNSVVGMFNGITTTGKFYYNSAYDYSKIIEVLPSTWTAVPM